MNSGEDFNKVRPAFTDQIETREPKVPWSYQKVFARFAERTTMHGIPYYHSSKTIGAKIFWFFIFLVAFGALIFHLVFLFQKYLAFDKTTTVTLGFDNLEFPAVTVCNVNPIRKSQLHLASPALREKANEMDPDIIIAENYLTAGENSTIEDILSRRKRSVDSESLSRDKRFLNNVNFTNQDATRAVAETEHEQGFENNDWEQIGAQDSFDKQIKEFFSLYNEEERSTRMEMGHDMDTMLIKCSFAGRSCYSENFTLFTHPKYGKCYTLQSGYFKSRSSGPDQGLELVLFLQNHDYIRGIASGYGLQVLIHDKDVLPSPAEEGLAVSAEETALIGLSLTRIQRLGAPNWSCQDVDAFKQKYGVKYSRSACQKFCEAVDVINTCGCADLFKEEINQKIFAFKGSSVDICETEAGLRCYYRVLRQYQTGKKTCTCEDPCQEVKYIKSYSSRKWPSTNFAKLLLSYLCTREGQAACRAYDVADERQLAQNFARLNIYYEDLNYKNITEQADYDFVQFISDVGGTIGLWIGLSVISIIEIGQFFAELIQFVCCRRKS